MPSTDIDFTGVTFKAGTVLFNLIPNYEVFVPHNVMMELQSAADATKAVSSLGAYLLLFPEAVPAAAGLEVFAVWMTTELYLAKWVDNGRGVIFRTWLTPAQPYWIPQSA